MGWTFQHREKGQSNLEWLRENLCTTEPERLLDCATKNGVIYGAYRTKAVPEGEPERVIALVILTMWVPNDYYNFGYKDLDEDMGPAEDDCPKRIFDMLDPLPARIADPDVDGNWAARWRERVQRNLDRPKVTKGTRVRFPPTTWRGGDYGILTYVGGKGGTNLFRTEYGRLLRLIGWRKTPYEVVSS